MVSHNLIPRGGHREDATFANGFVIEHILKKKEINLPYIMLSHMEEVHRHKTNLAYALIFTRIFRYFGVILDNRSEILV